MKAELDQYVAYNLWANDKMAELLLGQPMEMLDAEVESSFSTLRKTVYHIWDAEKIWLNRLQGVSFDFWPSSKLSVDAPIDAFLEESKAYLAYVHAQLESRLQGDLEFEDTQGTAYVLSIAGIVMHTMNHSTFHRGQLVTMLRSLGVTELPKTDLIEYLRVQAKQ